MRIEGSYLMPSSASEKTGEVKNTSPNNTVSSFSDFYEHISEDASAIYEKRVYYRVEVAETYEKPDYSTMSDNEIYNAVLDEYKHKYGDDFLEREKLCLSPVTYEESKIYFDFHLKLEKLLGGSKQIRAAAREAAYGDMTDDEVREAIVKQYSQDSMTLRDFMYISYEMKRVGVDVGTWQLASLMQSDPEPNKPRMISHGLNYTPQTAQEKNDCFLSLVDKPLNTASLITHLNGMRFANTPAYSHLTDQFISNLYYRRRLLSSARRHASAARPN